MFRSTSSSEYVALIGSLLLIGLEVFVRVITLALRKRSTCGYKLQRLNYFTSDTHPPNFLQLVGEYLQSLLAPTRREFSS